MATRIINIDGQEVALRSSGATYILFRHEFKKDLFVELNNINKEAVKNEGELPEFAIETLLEACYIMAEQAQKSGKTFEDWLDQFELMGSLDGLSGVLEMLNNDKETIDESKKNNDQESEK